MPYSATTYRLLISAPSDLPDEDIAVVTETIARWNVMYGPGFGAVLVPLHWRLHSAAKHGERPQATLNKQLVDDADILIALFWHRLGSPTGEADSGTLEEIDRAQASGAYVAILQCRRDIPQGYDLDQMGRLEDALRDLRANSLVLEYTDTAELARHADAIVNMAIGGERSAARHAATAQPPRGAEVWPRVERSQNVYTNLRGPQTETEWRLVLSNVGPEPARDVTFRLEPEGPQDNVPVHDPPRPLEVMPPGGDAQYALYMHDAVAPQARCVVGWVDSRGVQENRATLRFF